MSSDYTDFAKDPREDSRKRKLMVVHALLATAMAAILGGAWVVQRKGEVAQTRAAAPPPAGPACQPLTEAAYLAMPRPADRLFTYGGTVFGRRQRARTLEHVQQPARVAARGLEQQVARRGRQRDAPAEAALLVGQRTVEQGAQVLEPKRRQRDHT